MKIKLIIISLSLLFVFGEASFGDQLGQTRSLFYQGNTHYSEGDFEQAITEYEAALTLGFASGPLYYNLGNAYFKQGSLGKAVLNYLRAERLMPRDADLKSNLNYAQSLIEGGRVSLQRIWFRRLFFIIARSFSLDQLTLICAFLYFILAALIILCILMKNFRKISAYFGVPLLVTLIICSCLFFAQFYRIVILKEAVVIVESANSKFEPFEDATTFFTLYEGENVFVTGSKADWVKVKRRDGRQGWVQQSTVDFL